MAMVFCGADMVGDAIRKSSHRHIVTSRIRLTITILDSRFAIQRFNVSHLRDKIIEQLIINLSPFRMILHSESEGIVAQSYLLDDVIGCAPRLHFETGAQFIDCLMMRAIHFFKAMTRAAIRSQRLDVMRLLLRQVMAGDVEMKGTAERDIESLQSFADRENRKPAFDRMLDGVELPAIPIGIHILFDHRWIGNGLVQELGSNIGSAG